MIWELDDLEQLVPYLDEAHTKLNQAGKPNPDKFRYLLKDLFPTRNCWVIGNFRAALFGVVYPHPWADHLVGMIPWSFYREGYRPGAEFIRLYQRYIEWAESQGAYEINFSYQGHLSERWRQRLRRWGPDRMEAVYTRLIHNH